MGKNKKNNKKKYSAEPASNESETAAHCTSNKSEVETDGKKSSPTPESDLIDEMIKELIDALIECIKVEKHFREMTYLANDEIRQCAMQNMCTLNSLHKNLNTLLANRDPNFVEYVEKYITLKSEITYLKRGEAEAYEEMQISKKPVDANAPVTLAPVKLERGRIEADLYSQTDEKEMIGVCDISADDIQKESHTPQKVECKGSDRYTDDIQAKGQSPQITTERMEDNKGIHMCTEDDSKAEEISHILEAKYDEKQIMNIVAEMEESLRKESLSEMTHSETDLSPRQINAEVKSFANHVPELTELLMSHDPELEKYMDKCKNLQSEYLRNRSETTAEETVTTPNKHYTNKLQKVEENKDAYDIVRYVDVSEKAAHNPHTFQDKHEKMAKDSNRSTDNIQETEQILHSRELDYDKTLMKIKDNDLAKANNIPRVIHSAKTSEITPAANVSKRFENIQQDLKEFSNLEHSKLDNFECKRMYVETALKVLIEKRYRLLQEMERAATLSKDKTQELSRLSKEAADQVNDLIIEMEKAETENNVKKGDDKSIDDFKKESKSPRSLTEEKKCTKNSIRSTEHIQTVVHSPKDGTKDKKEEQTDTKDINTSTRHIQVEDSSVDTELDVDTETMGLSNDIEECIKKDESFLKRKHSKIMAEKISPKNPKMKTILEEECRQIFEELLALQSSTLDDQEEELNVLESAMELLKKERDLLYAEKENLISLDEAQYGKGIKKEPEIDSIEEVSTTVEQPHDSNKKTILFEKPEVLHFDFDTNGKKRIKVGSRNEFYLLEESQSAVFNFKEEKVHVSIIGSQILVSTPYSQFDIYVRTPQPVDLNDDATQTQAEP